IHEGTRKSALEVIFTTLHSGGKFDDDSYKTAGGLHGVGASVVNALSESLEVTVRRDGAEFRQNYQRGKPLGPVKKIGSASGSGTTVQFTPDATIFESIDFDADKIARHLEVKSFLHRGLKIEFHDEPQDRKLQFEHAGGIKDFLAHVNQQRGDTRLVGFQEAF